MTPGADADGRAAPPVVRLGVVDSTQAVALELAERGAADRTVVVADHQRAGRGRRGRAWTDEPGGSLLASIIVRARLAMPLLPTLSLTTAVAVAEALRRVAGVAARLKWPNDVRVGGRKIAGILLESHFGGGGAEASPVTVIGVGVNLVQATFPPELAEVATSVLLETGRRVERDAVLGVLLEEFDRWRGRLEGEGFGAVRARWLALSDTIGGPVSVNGVAGTAVDLAEDGALLVDTGSAIRRVSSGEIDPVAGRAGD